MKSWRLLRQLCLCLDDHFMILEAIFTLVKFYSLCLTILLFTLAFKSVLMHRFGYHSVLIIVHCLL